MKRLYSVLLICAAMAGMMLSITSTEAADLAKVRGRVNIDLDTFVCVEKTNNNSGMEPDNSEKTKYKMWFKNSFTDRNNIGVTYRSGQSYEMTDVDKVGCVGYGCCLVWGDLPGGPARGGPGAGRAPRERGLP